MSSSFPTAIVAQTSEFRDLHILKTEVGHQGHARSVIVAYNRPASADDGRNYFPHSEFEELKNENTDTN